MAEGVCPGNDVKLYLMARFQLWRSGECGTPLHHPALSAGALECTDCTFAETPPMGPPVGRGWRPVMLKDRTRVDEQFMTCNTPLWPYLRLDGRPERLPPINQLVTSSPSTYMIFPILLPLWQAPTLFIIWVLEGGG